MAEVGTSVTYGFTETSGGRSSVIRENSHDCRLPRRDEGGESA